MCFNEKKFYIPETVKFQMRQFWQAYKRLLYTSLVMNFDLLVVPR